MKNNRASRIHAIMAGVVGQANSQPGSNIWRQAFGVGTDVDDETLIELVGVLRKEIKLLLDDMSKTDIAPECYRRHLDSVSNATTSRHFHAKWGSPLVKTEDFLALRWCVEIMPDEGEIIDQESLKRLLKEFTELRDFVEGAAIGEMLRQLLLRCLNEAISAFELYQIQGEIPVTRAFKTIMGDVQASSQEITAAADESPDNQEAKKRFVEVMTKAGKCFEKTGKGGSLLHGYRHGTSKFGASSQLRFDGSISPSTANPKKLMVA